MTFRAPALLAASLAVVAVPPPPAAAQDSGEAIVVSARFGHGTREVYVAALDALEAQGYTLRIRSLDALLMTFPRFAGDPPAPHEVVPQLRVDVEVEGDSTRLTVRGRMVPAPPRELSKSDEERALAATLAAMVAAFGATDSVLKARAPAPRDLREMSDAYGYGRKSPVRVGGGPENGAREQRRFLDALRGPAGEPVRYRRLGSCCFFPAPRGYQGQGALDAFEITHDGLERPVVLYVEFYTEGVDPPAAPEGFTLAPSEVPRQES